MDGHQARDPEEHDPEYQIADAMESGSEVYASFIKDEYDQEVARRERLEARGITVVTSSGVLVTLVFGLGAVVTKNERWTPSNATVALVLVALAAFCVAAFNGIRANRLVSTEVVTPEVLEELRTKRWTDSATDAASVVAYARLHMLDGLRKMNASLAVSIVVALIAQLFALIAVCIAVGIALGEAASRNL